MTDESSQSNITGEAVLFGAGNHEIGDAQDDWPIVAVEPDAHTGVRVYRRSGSSVSCKQEPFLPWMLLRDPPGSDLHSAAVTELSGEGYRYLAEFRTQSDFHEVRFRLRDLRRESLSYMGAKSVLMRSGQTLFKELRFDEIVRLQFDIETFGLDPRPEHCRVFLIAVSDSMGFLELIEGDEREILERFIALVHERDPDVIEGHNVYGFDLPFIITRAERHGIRLSLGRDGSEPTKGRERNYAIGGATRPFTPVYIHGRHVLDTYLIVQRYDWARGSLSGYGLKECARTFGFAHENRVELPGAKIGEIYGTDPALVREYAQQDVVETRMLADLITPVEFYQTQMVPDNYGQVAVTGSGERINSLFVRAYLNAGQAVPLPESSKPFPGGYTEVRRTGVVERVVKADVESLYPSLMLTHHISPSKDSLGVFEPALRDLTQRRIEAKRSAAEAKDEATAQYWDGVQGSFKILINSFYGYLAGPFPWNDYGAARKVTELGRALVVDIAERIELSGGSVIEIDTDGVYFVPPEAVVEEAAEKAYVETLGSALRSGIRLAFDGRYARMLSVKTKNYVLESYDGKRTFKGSSLRSRADERFGRKFLESAVDLLLRNDKPGVGRLYSQVVDDLVNHRVGIEDLARRERVTEKTFNSDQKRRSKGIAEGVAIGDYMMIFEKAGGELGLVTDFKRPGDENTKHYIEKLFQICQATRRCVWPGVFRAIYRARLGSARFGARDIGSFLGGAPPSFRSEHTSFVSPNRIRATEKSRLIGIRDATVISSEHTSFVSPNRIRASDLRNPRLIGGNNEGLGFLSVAVELEAADESRLSLLRNGRAWEPLGFLSRGRARSCRRKPALSLLRK